MPKHCTLWRRDVVSDDGYHGHFQVRKAPFGSYVAEWIRNGPKGRRPVPELIGTYRGSGDAMREAGEATWTLTKSEWTIGPWYCPAMMIGRQRKVET